jgi:hypothetical protein
MAARRAAARRQAGKQEQYLDEEDPIGAISVGENGDRLVASGELVPQCSDLLKSATKGSCL